DGWTSQGGERLGPELRGTRRSVEVAVVHAVVKVAGDPQVAEAVDVAADLRGRDDLLLERHYVVGRGLEQLAIRAVGEDQLAKRAGGESRGRRVQGLRQLDDLAGAGQPRGGQSAGHRQLIAGAETVVGTVARGVPPRTVTPTTVVMKCLSPHLSHPVRSCYSAAPWLTAQMGFGQSIRVTV